MYQTLDTRAHRSAPPSLFKSLTELPRTLMEIQWLTVSMPGLSLMPRGDRHPVVTLPGFLAGDESTLVLRSYLRQLGYRAEPWQQGRNNGNPKKFLNGVLPLVETLAERYGEPVSLVGQSLGGVFAREIARRIPGCVRQVVTLGSPFAARDNNDTMRMVRVLFERQSGMSVEDMRELLLDEDDEISPDVPLTAIYSKEDGVVAWQACREAYEDDMTQNIRVPGSHCGMAFNPVIYYLIANRLAQAPDGWQPFTPDPLFARLLRGCSND